MLETFVNGVLEYVLAICFSAIVIGIPLGLVWLWKR